MEPIRWINMMFLGMFVDLVVLDGMFCGCL